MNNNDTIYSLITGNQLAAVSVIRLSGVSPIIDKVKDLFQIKIDIKPRQAHLVKLLDSESHIIDQALLIYYPAPHSFTGENVIEFNLHGSLAIIQQIFNIFSEQPDFRIANAGEFSRRAVENNKMNIIEAEGLLALINAKTLKQARGAMFHLSSASSRLYYAFQEEIANLLAEVEADIDFGETDILDKTDNILENCKRLHTQIVEYLSAHKRSKIINEGLNCAIIGSPNAGKSSFLNYLANDDIAIVSDIAGTTRDILTTQINIAGFLVSFFDTAGIHQETDDLIEKEGIRRSLKKAKESDLKLILLDISLPKEVLNNQLTTLKRLLEDVTEDGNMIYIFTKADLLEKEASEAKIAWLKLSLSREKNMPIIFAVSSKNGHNMESILNFIGIYATNITEDKEDALIANARHYELLTAVSQNLSNAIKTKDIELLAENLRMALRNIGKILGIVDIDEILGKIFSRFCIGK